MRIFIDGQRLPVNPKTTNDMLQTIKSMSKVLHWGVLYDIEKQTVSINTKSLSSPILPAERPSLADNEVESTRLIGKTICLDPGHGGNDPGAVGPTETCEKNNTLAIALLLKNKLEKNSAKVIMTRETDQDVAYADASANDELGARVDIANHAPADLFISIHNDAFTTETASGTTTFHYGDQESVKLATCVQECLVETLNTKNRGARFASFYVLRYTAMTSILVEAAFISNPEEELLLASDDGRCNIALSIFDGIVKYYKV